MTDGVAQVTKKVALKSKKKKNVVDTTKRHPLAGQQLQALCAAMFRTFHVLLTAGTHHHRSNALQVLPRTSLFRRFHHQALKFAHTHTHTHTLSLSLTLFAVW